MDIWIEDSVIMDNSPDYPEIFVDSDGLGSIPGMFHLTDYRFGQTEQMVRVMLLN